MDVHPDIEPVRALIGTWSGSGRGEYPTIDAFTYTEQVSFVPGPSKPFLAYSQRTAAADGAPLHSEVGYLRMTPDGPEFVIAQPTGLTEIHMGEHAGDTITFRSLRVLATPTAKPVTEVVRRMTVAGDLLTYTLDMAFDGVPLRLHLEAALHRVG